MSLSAPSKHLRYSETDFTGYWVQLNALIRHNDHADRVLDQILVNPLNTLCNLPEDSQLKADLLACYTANNFGFPPSEQLLREDPIPAIKEFKISTMSHLLTKTTTSTPGWLFMEPTWTTTELG